ncbi:MAG: hypothetical protein GY871_04070 [Actinomycetales bacterium]|nr:hypothetical protein [Actinomycetales bacterium]
MSLAPSLLWLQFYRGLVATPNVFIGRGQNAPTVVVGQGAERNACRTAPAEVLAQHLDGVNFMGGAKRRLARCLVGSALHAKVDPLGPVPLDEPQGAH